MKLLGFVALYGLILMPMGAVIFSDFWLSKRCGFESFYAEKRGLAFNWAPFLAWVLTLMICVLLVKFAGIQIFFVSLPGWFLAAGLYIMLSRAIQKKNMNEKKHA
jgi:purine-cytosine permease-like protein